MKGYCLLLLTLVFVGACTGRGHVQWDRSRASLGSSPFASASSTNGSSIEEILKELDVRYILFLV
jgi:hypothetical protein